MDVGIHVHKIRNGSKHDEKSLLSATVNDAEIIILLAENDADKRTDGCTFDTASRLREMGVTANIIAECVDDGNRARLFKAGADAVVRPIRSYPGMTVRACVAPGSEEVIENLFSTHGDEYLRFDLPFAVQKPWSQVVCQLMIHNLGTAVAYIDASDQVHCNPPGSEQIDAQALLVMAREESRPTLAQVVTALNANMIN